MNTVCADLAENLLIASKAVSQAKSSLICASRKVSCSSDFSIFRSGYREKFAAQRKNAIEIQLAKRAEPAA
jgi:hypothetical protein